MSKANTFAQLVFASLVLAELGLGLGLEPFVAMCIWVTGALTILSAIVYFWVWLSTWRAMSLSLRRYRRARTIGADQDRIGFAGQDLVSLGALVLGLPHRGAHGAAVVQWIVPAVLLELVSTP